MKKPCPADLVEAAEMLRDKRHLRLGACEGAAARVALWLDYQARDSDRSRARKLGVTVKYLRNVIDKEARA